MKLKGSASDWWQSINNNNVASDRPPITRWTNMHKILENKSLWQDSRQELIPYKPGTLSVDEHNPKFCVLNI